MNNNEVQAHANGIRQGFEQATPENLFKMCKS